MRKIIQSDEGTEQRSSAICLCILAGLVDRVAMRQDGRKYRLGNGADCVLDESTVAKGQLLAAADIRILPPRLGSKVALAYVTRIDALMLRQVAAHVFTSVRYPCALDHKTRLFTIREEIRFQEHIIESRESYADLLDTLTVIEEQRLRADRSNWRRVEVQAGIGRKSVVVVDGEQIPVNCGIAGPHWASVDMKRSPKVLIREQIFELPHEKEEPKVTISRPLQDKLARTSSALAKLLGNGS